MADRNLKLASAALALILAGCQPSDNPPNLVKSQRQVMDKAKAVPDQLQQRVDEQGKKADEEQK
jgi:hypothetical protein